VFEAFQVIGMVPVSRWAGSRVRACRMRCGQGRLLAVPHTPAASTWASATVRFFDPLAQEGYTASLECSAVPGPEESAKPVLVYLPGFDGTLLAPFLQFPELSTSFHVRGMQVHSSDRTPFAELVDLASTYIVQVGGGGAGHTPRPVYLVGESFGGLLASAVAARLQATGEIAGLVLVNPASSYPRSQLRSQASMVQGLPLAVYPLGLAGLLPLFADQHQLPQLLRIISSAGLPSVINTPAREAYMGRHALTLPRRIPFMARGTLRWRLAEWLEEGSAAVTDELLSSLDLPALVVAGEADEALPSLEEAFRLEEILPSAKVVVVPGAGHSSTCGARCDLAAAMRGRFPALQQPGRRTAMREEALRAGPEEADFGLIPRPHSSVPPWEYWSSKHCAPAPRDP